MKRHTRKDQAAGPAPEEAESGEDLASHQPMPEDSVESEGEKQAREAERGLDRALTRITPD